MNLPIYAHSITFIFGISILCNYITFTTLNICLCFTNIYKSNLY
nr:MAG TPA: hypothetical protein [Ackermannviridae sp.]